MRILLALLTTLFIALLTHVAPAGAAEPQASKQADCSLMSEGIYNGWWMKHRIVVGDDVIYGANDMDAIINQLDSLRGQGLCR